MPRTSCRSNPSANPAIPDVMNASITQLTRLPAEVLRLHLTSRHLVSTGTKATMAHRLYQAIHHAPQRTDASSTLPPSSSMFATAPTQTTMTLPLSSTTSPSVTDTTPIPTTQPLVSQQSIASFPPHFASLLTQFIQQATSGQMQQPVLSGQMVPAALPQHRLTTPRPLLTCFSPIHRCQSAQCNCHEYCSSAPHLQPATASANLTKSAAATAHLTSKRCQFSRCCRPSLHQANPWGCHSSLIPSSQQFNNSLFQCRPSCNNKYSEVSILILLYY